MKLYTVRLVALALFSGTTWASAQTYTVTDLGVLPGDQMSTAQGLNNSGQAAGSSSNANGEFSVATLFTGAGPVSLGSPSPSDDTIADAISDSGQVTGYIYDTGGMLSHTFLYTSGKMQDIDNPSLFPGGSDGTGVNDSGQVCGYGWPNTTITHAFLYSGTMVDLGTLGGAESVAEAINNAGQVVGQSTNAANVTHAFLYSNGKDAGSRSTPWRQCEQRHRNQRQRGDTRRAGRRQFG